MPFFVVFVLIYFFVVPVMKKKLYVECFMDFTQPAPPPPRATTVPYMMPLCQAKYGFSILILPTVTAGNGVFLPCQTLSTRIFFGNL